MLCQELLTLACASAYWWRFEHGKVVNDGTSNFGLKGFALHAVPGATHAAQNSTVFHGLMLLGLPTFSMPCNFKMFATAVLFRTVLKRRLINIQWAACVMLVCAMVASKTRVLMGLGQKSGAWSSDSDLYFGTVLVMVNSFFSGFSGIFNECLIKKIDPEAPLMFKNMQLHFCGAVINMMPYLLSHGAPPPNLKAGVDASADACSGFFRGFSVAVWLVILNNALLELTVAFIMKHANNVVKCFAQATQVCVTTYFSNLFLGEKLDAPFLLGLEILTCSLFLYMGDHNKLMKETWPKRESTRRSVDATKAMARKDGATHRFDEV